MKTLYRRKVSKGVRVVKHIVKHIGHTGMRGAYGLFLIDSLGSRRGVIGDDVGIGRGASLVASPERSAVV